MSRIAFVSSDHRVDRKTASDRLFRTLTKHCGSRKIVDDGRWVEPLLLGGNPIFEDGKPMWVESLPTPSWIEFLGRSWEYIEQRWPAGTTWNRMLRDPSVQFQVGANTLRIMAAFERLPGGRVRRVPDYFTFTASGLGQVVGFGVCVEPEHVANDDEWPRLSRQAKAIHEYICWNGTREYEFRSTPTLYRPIDTGLLYSWQSRSTPEEFAESIAPAFDAVVADPLAAIKTDSDNCCLCGKRLTVGESRATGIGPDCFEGFRAIFMSH